MQRLAVFSVQCVSQTQPCVKAATNTTVKTAGDPRQSPAICVTIACAAIAATFRRAHFVAQLRAKDVPILHIATNANWNSAPTAATSTSAIAAVMILDA
eukprot:COSAG05_NODE_10552_length_559_cov_0.886957_1_plen_98_part_01